MTRRQILLFLLLGSGTVVGLVLGTAEQTRRPAVDTVSHRRPSAPAPATDAEEEASPAAGIRPGRNAPALSRLTGVFVQAAPKFIVWKDPDNPADPVEIPTFTAWTLRADSVVPLTRPEGDRVGALCRNVIFETFRTPRTQIEALALARQDRGAQGAVLHRRIRAEEARIYGRMVPQLLQEDGLGQGVRLTRDSEIRFSKNLSIFDSEEQLKITGEEITAYPKLGTASGKKRFVITHAGFIVAGIGIELNRIDDGRALAEILKKASLRLVNRPGDKRGSGGLALGRRDFRSASVTAEGRAIIRRDELPSGERLRIEMFDFVHLVQAGGRSLDAQRLTVEAVRDHDPDAHTDARAGGWRLRRLQADDDVVLRESKEGAHQDADLLTARTDHLTHDVPRLGVPTTLFEGNTSLTFEGDVPLNGRGKRGGLMRASCSERLWIGPVVGHVAPTGISQDALRRVLLTGNARLERHGQGQEAGEEDILEGDEIELVFFAEPVTGDAPTRSEAAAPGLDQATALEFTARGHVRLGGTRIHGSTDLLVAHDLASAHPTISAIGPGTRFSFPGIRSSERLVGRDEPAVAGGSGSSNARARSESAQGAWRVRRLDADGDVDVSTSLGGPALGLPTHMTGTRLTYDALSNQAQLFGTAGNPARIEADSLGPQPNTIQAQTLRFDRQRGRVSASGGVRGSLWTERRGLNARSVRGAFRRGEPAPAGVLEITTDARIDIGITRSSARGGVLLDTEQIVHIHGPLKAELRSDRMVIDRLRANQLEIALVLATPEPTSTPAPAAFPGLSRTARPRAAPSASARPQAVPAERLMKMEFDAGEISADVSSGIARHVDAFGGVRLTSEMGEVIGYRITYDGPTHTIDVLGRGAQGAEAWFAAGLGLRNMVAAQRFVLTLDEHGTNRIQAEPAPGKFVKARLFQGSSQAGTHTSTVEGYAIWSRGAVDLQSQKLTARDVVVERRVSRDGGRNWSEPARLWSKTLQVLGRNLLAGSGPSAAPGPGTRRAGSPEVGSNVDRIIAEGDKTKLQTGHGRDQIRVTGQRVVLDAKAATAVITGAPGAPVRSRLGEGESEVDGAWREVTIDLKTGLPQFRGPKIVLHQDK